MQVVSCTKAAKGQKSSVRLYRGEMTTVRVRRLVPWGVFSKRTRTPNWKRKGGGERGREEARWSPLAASQSEAEKLCQLWCDAEVKTRCVHTDARQPQLGGREEDGAAPRRCHVSVHRRNPQKCRKERDVGGGLVVFLSPVPFRRGGRAVHRHRPAPPAESGQRGAAFDQLHGRRAGGILRFVVRTLHRLFSSLQTSGERH